MTDYGLHDGGKEANPLPLLYQKETLGIGAMVVPINMHGAPVDLHTNEMPLTPGKEISDRTGPPEICMQCFDDRPNITNKL